MAQVQTTKGAPRGAKREIEQKAGIGVRDLVTVAVFSVIYFIIFFACGCLILRAGAYKSTRCAVAAHAAFSLWVVGTMLPMWILGQAYFEPFRSSQGDAYVNEMLGLLSGGMLAVVVIGIVACAVVGALVGRAVLKKHFERAGIA